MPNQIDHKLRKQIFSLILLELEMDISVCRTIGRACSAGNRKVHQQVFGMP
jgi:hypothetical protein